MKLSDRDIKEIIERYSDRLNEFGYSPKTLGWEKGKQDLRFDILTSQFDLSGRRILDIGCGFGDLNKTLFNKYGDHYSYYGIDLVPKIIEIGREIFNSPNIRMDACDFLGRQFSEKFDYAFGSGIFNFKLKDVDNYEYIEDVIEKSLDICDEGIAFDFLSDKVDYQYQHTFHSSPEKILSIAYKFSRNIILRNDYMPFEFALFIFKDGSFLKEDTIFLKYKQRNMDGGFQ
ncbi:MAG: class I SAM-dependent methyltransferase [Deltaproteobacteria bacterium]